MNLVRHTQTKPYTGLRVTGCLINSRCSVDAIQIYQQRCFVAEAVRALQGGLIFSLKVG